MNAWVDDLFAAIARQEGEFSGQPDTPQERNNPLDLRYAKQLGALWFKPGTFSPPPEPGPGEEAPIAWFESLESGTAAGYRQIWKRIAEGVTLRALIYDWAPPSENNSAVYLANVAQWTGIHPEQVLLRLLELVN